MTRSGATLTEIEAVYRRRGRDFFRLALARTGDSAIAQDAVQEGFARAIRGRARLRNTGALEPWIGRCVLNAAHDAAERHRHAEHFEESLEATQLAEIPDPAVRLAVRALPPRQRDALFLRFYLDFDYATIAETLGIEVGTVSATLHAARHALAHTLREVAT
jgi:RNA polymerase sigma factor (sigma-70 family)